MIWVLALLIIPPWHFPLPKYIIGLRPRELGWKLRVNCERIEDTSNTDDRKQKGLIQNTVTYWTKNLTHITHGQNYQKPKPHVPEQ